jgi:hypothetical protein
VGAARKYTDEQRAAMHSLWQRGHRGANIARLMSAGTPSVAGFEIPRRTVHEICTRMDLERGTVRPETLEHALDPRRMSSHPEACERILDTVLARLEAKANAHGLNLRELEQLGKATTIAFALERQMQRRRAEPAVKTVPPQRKAKSKLAERLQRAKQRQREELVEPVLADLPENP